MKVLITRITGMVGTEFARVYSVRGDKVCGNVFNDWMRII